MENQGFEIGSGRPRPPYEPKNIKCAGCGAGLSVKDERSELVVCEYCGSHLEVSREEATVLGKGPDRKWDFPFNLGERFRHKSTTYEVTARLALIEDGDTSELTRQYLLYNPRRGTMWLAEYKGHYDLSSTTHVMPVGNALSKNRGDRIKTHDGNEWVCEGSGVYELAYVDGSLPWLAKVGDAHRYAEYSHISGDGQTYEVEAHGNEIEYATGRKMPSAMVRRAFNRSDLAEPTEKLEDAAKRRKEYLRLIAMCAIALGLNLLLSIGCMFKGSTVLEQSFTADELSAETLSEPFRVSKPGNVVKVKTRASVSNAWMALDIAVVEGDDKVVHLVEEDIQYYHGSSGGESWSEGSKKATTYFVVPSDGVHRLLVHAVSASGDAPSSETCSHPVRIKVIDGAAKPSFFILMTVVSFFALIIAAIRYGKWKAEED